MNAFLSGYALGFSLILAIGAQNAFVLKQGLKREYVFAVCLTCAVSDALLITAGVSGASLISNGWWAEALRWGGVLFLLVYGLRAFRSAWIGGSALTAVGSSTANLWKTVAICLAFTWLNPHVYLDTLVLIGSISTGWPGQKLAFGSGAVLASFVFFFSLGFGARLLAPVFARPDAWRFFEAIVGIVMLLIAAGLAFG